MVPIEVTRLINRRVSADELREALEGPIAAGEREDILALIAWFTGRYGSAAERLAYIKRAYARWLRTA